MTKLFLWIIFLGIAMYGGWYWYDRLPKAYTILVGQTAENRGVYYPEAACEETLASIQNERKRAMQTCSVASAERIDTDNVAVDVKCRDAYARSGCFICRIQCDPPR